MFIDRKIQYFQNVSSSKLDLQIQNNPNQNLSKLFFGYQQTDSKVIWRGIRPRIVNTILEEKNKFGGLTLSDFKTYSKATVIMTVWHWGKSSQLNHWNRIETPEVDTLKRKISPPVYHLLLTNKFLTLLNTTSVCGQYSTRRNSATPAGVLQFSSVLTLSTQSSHQNPHVKGSVPQDCTPLHFRCQLQVRVIICASNQLLINQRFPRPIPWVRLNCQSGSQNSSKHLLT